jgi:hypothetical protein
MEMWKANSASHIPTAPTTNGGEIYSPTNLNRETPAING